MQHSLPCSAVSATGAVTKISILFFMLSGEILNEYKNKTIWFFLVSQTHAVCEETSPK